MFLLALGKNGFLDSYDISLPNLLWNCEIFPPKIYALVVILWLKDIHFGEPKPVYKNEKKHCGISGTSQSLIAMVILLLSIISYAIFLFYRLYCFR
jgi:hypothetical protein